MRRLFLVPMLALACGGGPPVIESFTVDEANPDVGAPVSFSYVVRGASTVRIDPMPGIVQRSPVTVIPRASGTFTLRATNGSGKEATSSLAIALRPLLAIDAADVLPGQVLPGAEVKLAWGTTSAERATLTDGATGEVREVPTSGSLLVRPAATTIYTLTAYNKGGRRPDSLTARMPARVGVPPTVSGFSVDKATIVQGEAATLSWVGNAVSYSVSDGTTTFNVGPRRSLVVRPAVTTSYVLQAKGTGGTSTTPPLTVTVEPHPATMLTYAPAPTATAPLQLVADPCNPCSAVTLRLKAGATFALRGLALNLPLDVTKVTFDGFAAGTPLSAALAKAAMGTGPLQDVLVVGVALRGTGTAPAQDVMVNAGDEVASFTLGLRSGAGAGKVFDGAAPGAGYKASVQTASGRNSGAIAVGKLEAN